MAFRMMAAASLGSTYAAHSHFTTNNPHTLKLQPQDEHQYTPQLISFEFEINNFSPSRSPMPLELATAKKLKNVDCMPFVHQYKTSITPHTLTLFADMGIYKHNKNPCLIIQPSWNKRNQTTQKIEEQSQSAIFKVNNPSFTTGYTFGQSYSVVPYVRGTSTNPSDAFRSGNMLKPLYNTLDLASDIMAHPITTRDSIDEIHFFMVFLKSHDPVPDESGNPTTFPLVHENHKDTLDDFRPYMNHHGVDEDYNVYYHLKLINLLKVFDKIYRGLETPGDWRRLLKQLTKFYNIFFDNAKLPFNAFDCNALDNADFCDDIFVKCRMLFQHMFRIRLCIVDGAHRISAIIHTIYNCKPPSCLNDLEDSPGNASKILHDPNECQLSLQNTGTLAQLTFAWVNYGNQAASVSDYDSYQFDQVSTHIIKGYSAHIQHEISNTKDICVSDTLHEILLNLRGTWICL